MTNGEKGDKENKQEKDGTVLISAIHRKEQPVSRFNTRRGKMLAPFLFPLLFRLDPTHMTKLELYRFIRDRTCQLFFGNDQSRMYPQPVPAPATTTKMEADGDAGTGPSADDSNDKMDTADGDGDDKMETEGDKMETEGDKMETEGDKMETEGDKEDVFPFKLYYSTTGASVSSVVREMSPNDENVGEMVVCALKNSQSVFLIDWTDQDVAKALDAAFIRSIRADATLETVKDDSKAAIPLESCIELFSKEEKLSSSDAWYCSTCQTHREATKQITVWKLPKILVIHLKRFQLNRLYSDKIDRKVDFPLKNFDMSKFCHASGSAGDDDEEKAQPPIYNLFGVSNHSGSLGYGHYTAYCFNKSQDGWYDYNDSLVSPRNADSIVSNSAYMLFYERADLSGKKPASFTFSEDDISKSLARAAMSDDKPKKNTTTSGRLRSSPMYPDEFDSDSDERYNYAVADVTGLAAASVDLADPAAASAVANSAPGYGNMTDANHYAVGFVPPNDVGVPPGGMHSGVVGRPLTAAEIALAGVPPGVGMASDPGMPPGSGRPLTAAERAARGIGNVGYSGTDPRYAVSPDPSVPPGANDPAYFAANAVPADPSFASPSDGNAVLHDSLFGNDNYIG
eukprot:TRINITY_DN2540_c0_g2_i1.p1 TRINITY_DN2540_c0_g2~~TRINITY_DN2540_c0_g2_i1.p1  ORF type:complete len:625 (-),score=136.51 TRINITY_DN2540_c0_g2_i1:194-2068(-)